MPETDDLTESIADIIKIVHPVTRAVSWGILVTLADGQQFMSDQMYSTAAIAEEELRRHLRELGCPEQDINTFRVQ